MPDKFFPVTKKSGFPNTTGYTLGRFTASIAGSGAPPDWLVRWKQTSPEYRGYICRELDMDLTPGGKVTIDWRPDTLFALLETSQTPVTPPVVPPVEPPPVTPPPVTPPQPPATTGIKMTITRAGGMRIIFLDWFEDGIEVTLIAPDGRIVNKTKTGAKGSEYGLHSCEAGFAAVDGSYLLQIGREKFSLPVSGSGAIKLHFERTVAPGEEMVRLVSVPLVEPRSGTVLATANHLALDRLGVDGLFKAEAI